VGVLKLAFLDRGTWAFHQSHGITEFRGLQARVGSPARVSGHGERSVDRPTLLCCRCNRWRWKARLTAVLPDPKIISCRAPCAENRPGSLSGMAQWNGAGCKPARLTGLQCSAELGNRTTGKLVSRRCFLTPPASQAELCRPRTAQFRPLEVTLGGTPLPLTGLG